LAVRGEGGGLGAGLGGGGDGGGGEGGEGGDGDGGGGLGRGGEGGGDGGSGGLEQPVPSAVPNVWYDVPTLPTLTRQPRVVIHVHRLDLHEYFVVLPKALPSCLESKKSRMQESFLI
jgi:hypothetical protein